MAKYKQSWLRLPTEYEGINVEVIRARQSSMHGVMLKHHHCLCRLLHVLKDHYAGFLYNTYRLPHLLASVFSSDEGLTFSGDHSSCMPQQVYPEMGAKTRRTWHTDNNLFGKPGDDMEKIALFSP